MFHLLSSSQSCNSSVTKKKKHGQVNHRSLKCALLTANDRRLACTRNIPQLHTVNLVAHSGSSPPPLLLQLQPPQIRHMRPTPIFHPLLALLEVQQGGAPELPDKMASDSPKDRVGSGGVASDGSSGSMGTVSPASRLPSFGGPWTSAPALSVEKHMAFVQFQHGFSGREYSSPSLPVNREDPDLRLAYLGCFAPISLPLPQLRALLSWHRRHQIRPAHLQILSDLYIQVRMRWVQDRRCVHRVFKFVLSDGGVGNGGKKTKGTLKIGTTHDALEIVKLRIRVRMKSVRSSGKTSRTSER
ncbi:hypothetical protein V8E53_003807 [Lactarius tabidus]